MTVEQMLEELRSIQGASLYARCGREYVYGNEDWILTLTVLTDGAEIKINASGKSISAATQDLFTKTTDLRKRGLSELTPCLLAGPAEETF